MSNWTKTKVSAAEINDGNKYEAGDNLSVEQLNAVVDNSLYCADVADKCGDTLLNFRLCGEYNNICAYKFPNIVTFNGSSYMAIYKADNEYRFFINVLPDNTQYWKKIAYKGDQGIKGDKGETGGQGPKGEKGEGFSIKKIYSGVGEMNADYGNPEIEIGDFVIINSNVDDEDNSKLYVKGVTAYSYLTDLSGAQGIQGPVGTTPDISIIPTAVSPESGATVSKTGTVDAPVFNISIPRGRDGADGTDGVNGQDGITPTFSINEQGELIATYIPEITATHITEIMERGSEGYFEYDGSIDELKAACGVSGDVLVKCEVYISNVGYGLDFITTVEVPLRNISATRFFYDYTQNNNTYRNLIAEVRVWEMYGGSSPSGKTTAICAVPLTEVKEDGSIGEAAQSGSRYDLNIRTMRLVKDILY